MLDMLDDLLTCESQEELHRLGDACVKRLGFDAWVYVAMPRGGGEVPYLAGSLPSTWYVHHFQQGHAAADPVFAHCRHHSIALIWDAEHVAGEADSRCPVFFSETADFGLRCGVSIPVHGLGCQWGVVAVASMRLRDEVISVRKLGELHLFAAYVHDVGHRLATAVAGTEHVHLTARERECLRWTAEGKTGWEISKVLGISERTVVFHLENAARKFGVFGRRQAAARAIALQMISL
ncbi:MAG: LuxR family transcriptional regulator [Dokdonella sp.]